MTASRLNFCSLALSVWLVLYLFSIVKSLFMGRLRIALVFLDFTIDHLISESPLGKTPATMAIFQNCLVTLP